MNNLSKTDADKLIAQAAEGNEKAASRKGGGALRGGNGATDRRLRQIRKTARTLQGACA